MRGLNPEPHQHHSLLSLKDDTAFMGLGFLCADARKWMDTPELNNGST